MKPLRSAANTKRSHRCNIYLLFFLRAFRHRATVSRHWAPLTQYCVTYAIGARTRFRSGDILSFFLILSCFLLFPQTTTRDAISRRPQLWSGSPQSGAFTVARCGIAKQPWRGHWRRDPPIGYANFMLMTLSSFYWRGYERPANKARKPRWIGDTLSLRRSSRWSLNATYLITTYDSHLRTGTLVCCFDLAYAEWRKTKTKRERAGKENNRLRAMGRGNKDESEEKRNKSF